MTELGGDAMPIFFQKVYTFEFYLYKYWNLYKVAYIYLTEHFLLVNYKMYYNHTTVEHLLMQPASQQPQHNRVR